MALALSRHTASARSCSVRWELWATRRHLWIDVSPGHAEAHGVIAHNVRLRDGEARGVVPGGDARRAGVSCGCGRRLAGGSTERMSTTGAVLSDGSLTSLSSRTTWACGPCRLRS